MKKRALGSTGMQLSPVSFGGITVSSLSDEETSRLVNDAIDAGINYFDTAHSYADTSEKLGRVLPGRRDEVHVGAKVLDRTEKEAYERLTGSLDDLNMEYTDIMWLHAVDTEEMLDQVLGEGGAVHAIARCREEGLTRYLGITGHRPDLIARALKRFPFDVVMTPINYVYRFSFNAEGGLLPLCRRRGVGVVAIKPRAYQSIHDISDAYRYVLSQGVTTVIPHGTPEEMRMALGVLDGLEEMSACEVESLLGSAPELEGRCRQCGFCLPCPEGIDIPRVLGLEDIWHGPHRVQGLRKGYHTQDWARHCYSELGVSGKACTGCRVCEDRCPHGVPVAEMIAESHRTLTLTE